MSETAPVAVVIANWNGADWLPGCLDSLRSLQRPPAEIIVVDNGSEDESAAIVAGFPEVVWLPLGENTGFCHANNLGIVRTQAPYVLALNPDTKLGPQFLEAQLPAFDQDPRLGLSAGKLLRFDGTTIDSAGQLLSRSRQPIDRGYGTPDRGQFDEAEEVFSVCGAAALYRREMLERVALGPDEYFDERFFAFYEDLDLAWRARRQGWRVRYEPRAVGQHARGATVQPGGDVARFTATWKRSADVRFHLLKNRWLMLQRNDTAGERLKNLPWILARDGVMLIIAAVRSPGVLLRLWRERTIFRSSERGK